MMDRGKKIRILAALDAALALAIVAGLVLGNPGSRAGRGRALRLPEAAAVAGILIEAPGKAPVRLELAADGWVSVSGDGRFPAAGRRVEAFLAALDGLGALEKVAESASARADLGLEASAASTLTLSGRDGSTLATVLVGGYAPAGGKVYLAAGGGSEAWLAPGTIASYVKGDDSAWLDLSLFPAGLRVADAQAVRVEGTLVLDGASASYRYALARSSDGWVDAADKSALDPVAVESMLRALGGLRGLEYALAGETPGPVACVVLVAMGDGSELRLELEGALADGRYPASASGRRMYLAPYAVAEAVRPLSALRSSQAGQ